MKMIILEIENIKKLPNFDKRMILVDDQTNQSATIVVPEQAGACALLEETSKNVREIKDRDSDVGFGLEGFALMEEIVAKEEKPKGK